VALCVACLLICLIEERGPVLDGASHHAQVDQVERRDVVPVQFEVVDEKLDVYGDTESVSDMPHDNGMVIRWELELTRLAGWG
jgi:hypothetical protein